MYHVMMNLKRHGTYMNIKIYIEKSPIPLVWVDTSIIIFLAKLKVGEKLDDQLKEKIQFLYDSIIEGRRKKKLLCPRADQAEEFETGERLENECKKIQADLSLNIAMKHRFSVEDFCVKTFMKAYIEDTKEINLSYRNLFHEDPLEELDEKSKQKFIVRVEFPTPKNIINDIKQSKKNAFTDYENLRKQNISDGITFEEQLTREYKGTHDGLIEKIRRFNAKIKNNEPIEYSEVLGIDNILYYLQLWERYNGQPQGPQGLFEFFLSDYHFQIPKINIECNLFAKLLTGTAPIKSGDSMDIQQLSIILPFFNLVITDKTRKSDIESLDCHNKYNVRVLALKNFEEIKFVLKSYLTT